MTAWVAPVYVWFLPRALYTPGSHAPVFHPWREGWWENHRTPCGEPIQTGPAESPRDRMLMGDRRIVELFARPCHRCPSEAS